MGSRKNENGIYVVSDYIVCDRYFFEGTATKVKEYIDHIVQGAIKMGMVGEGYFDFSIDSYYNDYDLAIKYYFDRNENEKERAAREKVEAAEKAAAAERRRRAAEKAKLKKHADYAKYLELKEKFEPK
jgi:hypothetical protein